MKAMFSICGSAITKMLIVVVLLPLASEMQSLTNTLQKKRGQRRHRKDDGESVPHPRRFHCPSEMSPHSRAPVCPLSKTRVENQAGFQNCEAILSLLVRNISILICVSSDSLLLPNTSIVYSSKNKTTYPIHNSEMSPKIKHFFTGSLLMFRTLFYFHGNLHKSKLYGKADIFGTTFELQCSNLEKKFKALKTNACYQCRAFCLYSKPKKSFINLHHIDLWHNGSRHENVDTLRKIKRNRKKMLRAEQVDGMEKLTCSLHLVADHLFFKYVGNGDVAATTNRMLELVEKVNSIFRKNFKPRLGVGQVCFVVRYITVFENELSGDYNLGDSYMTPDEYLKKFSLHDFSSVCLGVGFTFRNFGGILGTAFPAYSSFKNPGGICNKRIKTNSHHVSYNTVIMSFFSPSGKLSERNLTFTLTHELGHSFGAKHDETEECLPGKSNGNYIMSATQNSGDKSNNFMFSPCSMRSILPVIMKNKKCLLALSQTPVCGNGVPEEGEACDCGSSNQCKSLDHCCVPADDTSHQPCTIRKHEGKLCSPKTSQCCTSSCFYVSRVTNKVCHPKNACFPEVTCNGMSEHCPAVRPHKAPCQEGQHILDGGLLCSGGNCPPHNSRNHTDDASTSTNDYIEEDNNDNNDNDNATYDKHCNCKDNGVGNNSCCEEQDKTTMDKAIPSLDWPDSSRLEENNTPNNLYQYEESFNLTASENRTVPFSMYTIMVDNARRVVSFWPMFSLSIILLGLITTMLCSAFQQYRPYVDDSLNAFRCGKLLGIYSIGEYQTDVYRGRMKQINRAYRRAIEMTRARRRNYTTAVARLKVLFPDVPISDLEPLAKLCANESMAVRILLTHGAVMRTFSTSMKALRNALRQATIHYKK